MKEIVLLLKYNELNGILAEPRFELYAYIGMISPEIFKVPSNCMFEFNDTSPFKMVLFSTYRLLFIETSSETKIDPFIDKSSEIIIS